MVSLSIWEKESFYAPCDIAIVGAGLMGLWTALSLKEKNPRVRITILEKNKTPLGASTRNAGFACFGSPTELFNNLETIGKDDMLRIVEMRYKGIEKIRRYFTDEQIDFDPCGGYECINKDSRYWPALDDRISHLNKLLKDITGKRSVFTYAGNKLDSLGLQHFDTLVENNTEAALHSGKLIQVLTKLVISKGVQILYNFELKDWNSSANDIELISSGGERIKAWRTVLCTNAFTPSLIPDSEVTPGRGQIILTSPIPNLPMKGTFHFDEGYYYWRNLGNRILLGGGRNLDFEGETTTNMEGSSVIKTALEVFLRHHMHPSIQYNIEQSWSGIMAFTDTRQPITTFKGEFFVAIACNGMGVALTPVIAESFAGDILSHY